uniref:Cas1_AcylT domain-containing protein n=1 Tax=Globodera pallida TaxID=36090 RepID=A0A183C494_GLOPA
MIQSLMLFAMSLARWLRLSAPNATTMLWLLVLMALMLWSIFGDGGGGGEGGGGAAATENAAVYYRPSLPSKPHAAEKEAGGGDTDCRKRPTIPHGLHFVMLGTILALLRCQHFVGLPRLEFVSNAIQLIMTLRVIGLAYEIADIRRAKKVHDEGGTNGDENQTTTTTTTDRHEPNAIEAFTYLYSFTGCSRAPNATTMLWLLVLMALMLWSIFGDGGGGGEGGGGAAATENAAVYYRPSLPSKPHAAEKEAGGGDTDCRKRPTIPHGLHFVMLGTILALLRCQHFVGLPRLEFVSNAIQLIMTLRVIGLAYEIADIRRAKKVHDEGGTNGDENQTTTTTDRHEPNAIEAFTYLYSFTGLFTGPYYTYKTYSDAIGRQKPIAWTKLAPLIGQKLHTLCWTLPALVLMTWLDPLNAIRGRQIDEYSMLSLFFWCAMAFVYMRMRVYSAWMVCAMDVVNQMPMKFY